MKTPGPFIRPRRAGEVSGGALSSGRGLPSDLLEQAGRRLEMASLFLAAAFGVALVLYPVVRGLGWYSVPRPGAHAAIAAAMIALSLALALTARRGNLDPARLLDLGLAYEVVVAFGISMGDALTPLTGERPLEEISWLCVWIVLFPLVVPTTPVKTLLASLLAAGTWPAAYRAGLALGNPAAAPAVVAMNALENLLAAALALVPSFILGRMGAEVRRARAMGSYELVERLDRGGMGEVWRARHQMLARPAAIKLIRPDRLALGEGAVAENLVRRFEREAQATASLHSPHSVELYDFGVTRDGTFYYVMEMLDGLDLESLVRRYGAVPPERAVHFLLQACDSLADAHHAGLVHRDVKPANLYACRWGLKDDFLKVLDFGLVKASWADHAADPSLTRDGFFGGTPAYLAPEVARGEPEVDARVDLYGLGCVAYWLLVGERVFEGETPLQLAHHHASTPPVPPSRRSELPVPQALEDVVLACLEKDPGRRPPTAAALADRLLETGLAAAWTPARARRWWEAHRPAPSPASPGPADTETLGGPERIG